MPKVYVVGAQIAAGGAYMAYHIGRILHAEMGYEFVNVRVQDEGARIFEYDIGIRTVSLESMISEAKESDILIANPSFSSMMLSLRCKAKKIMYVQDYRTYKHIDQGFDLYVSVSNVVKNCLSTIYGIQTEIIPPFIQTYEKCSPQPWIQRPTNSVFVYQKFRLPEYDIYANRLLGVLKQQFPDLELSQIYTGRSMPQSEFINQIAGHRFLLNICLGEGFGLIPLEAMSLGTIVIGTNGIAGKDYMLPGYNCFTADAIPISAISQNIRAAINLGAGLEIIASNALNTAQNYNYEKFKSAWAFQLRKIIT
jgi:hypothetical protein